MENQARVSFPLSRLAPSNIHRYWMQMRILFSSSGLSIRPRYLGCLLSIFIASTRSYLNCYLFSIINTYTQFLCADWVYQRTKNREILSGRWALLKAAKIMEKVYALPRRHVNYLIYHYHYHFDQILFFLYLLINFLKHSVPLNSPNTTYTRFIVIVEAVKSITRP